MIDTNELIEKEDLKNLKLPEELIGYLIDSERLSEKLFISVLKDIEDLYLYYSNIYRFKISEFCHYAINCIERSNNIDTFRYYLKKILEDNLHVSERHVDIAAESIDFKKIKTEKFEKISKEVVSTYIDLVDSLHKEETIDLIHVFKAFGKLELLLELEYDPFNKKLLESGRYVLEEYLSNDLKKDKEDG